MTYRQRADHARVAVGELVHYAGTRDQGPTSTTYTSPATLTS